MSDAHENEHMTDDAAGRHRGPASPEEPEAGQPHGRHRRPADD
ncbi:hypothetical protein [Actinacidiphila acididurans]|nr:hypothetical protein [Actinacidiphila acididurans]